VQPAPDRVDWRRQSNQVCEYAAPAALLRSSKESEYCLGKGIEFAPAVPITWISRRVASMVFMSPASARQLSLVQKLSEALPHASSIYSLLGLSD
jgi:hypothetical protein